MTVLIEVSAMLFGLLSLSVFLLSAYLCRRDSVSLLDCVTTMLWVSANFVWMSGEFFLRYRNLQVDDSNEGNDSGTRIASLGLFAAGILLQIIVIVNRTISYYSDNRRRLSGSILNSGDDRIDNEVEMVGINNNNIGLKSVDSNNSISEEAPLMFEKDRNSRHFE